MVHVYIVTGYAHFLMGFFYQAKSLFQHTQNPIKNLTKVWASTLLVSAGFLWALTFNSLATALLLFIILYFIYHGALNEKTFYERYLGKTARKEYLLVTGITFWLFVDSFRHSSIAFDLLRPADSSGLSPDTFLESIHFSEIFLITTALLICWILYLVISLLKERAWVHLGVILGMLVVSAILWLVFNPLSFVFLLSFILTYHFVTWWFVYAQVFWEKRSSELSFRNYIFASIFTHGLFMGIALLGYAKFMQIPTFVPLFEFLFTITIFRIVTFLHITTSFFNELSIKKIFNIT